jgi:hypothetical protein
MLGLNHGEICRARAIQFIIDIMTKTRSKKGCCDADPGAGICWPRRRSEPELLEPLAPQPRLAPDSTTKMDGIHRSHAGATEDQVNMAGTVPERVDKHGTKIEEIAGTGQHDSLGG